MSDTTITPTPFSNIYQRFLGFITDDMYVSYEWTEDEVKADEENILLLVLPNFEFPRFDILNYNIATATFNSKLTAEEETILARLMMIEWLQRNIANIELIRQKYSGSDFKMTSQANHLSSLLALKKQFLEEDRHAQRLYKRRKNMSTGYILSNWADTFSKSAIK
jgi:hypothetical protein